MAQARDARGRFTGGGGGGVQVASLFGSLGIKLDGSSWANADNAIQGLQGSLSSLAKLAAGALAGFSVGAAIKSGIAFNATLEDTRTQIAGMLSLAKHTDLADQLDTADELMKSLQERAKKLPGSMTDYTKVLGMIAQPITDAGIGVKDLEDITVGTAVAAKAMSIDLEAGARDVNQAIMGQFHATDMLTGRILGSLGYIGEEGRQRFNALSKAQRAAVLKDALTQKQLAQLADAQSKTASGRWDTFKAQIQETLGRVAAPLFAKLSSLLSDVNDWLDKNGDAVEKVAGVIGGALETAFDAVVAVLGFLTSGGDEANAVLLGIAAVVISVVVPALAAMAAGWIVALAPVLAVVAAVALVAYGVIKLVKHWDTVRRVAGKAWDWIKEKASAFWDWLSGLPGRFVDALADFGQRIIDAFARAWAVVKQGAEDAFNYVSHLSRQIPVLGWLGEKLGQGTGYVVNHLGGGDNMDGIDSFQTAPSMPSPMYSPSPNAGGRNITVGPTAVNVYAAPGMDEEQVGRIAAQKAREGLNDALRVED